MSYFCKSVIYLISRSDIDDSKFIGSSVINSSFAHNKTGCQMTFDDDYSAYWVYFINFLGTLAVLPGNIVSALLMDKVGRLSMLGQSLHQIHQKLHQIDHIIKLIRCHVSACCCVQAARWCCLGSVVSFCGSAPVSP